MRYIKLSEAEQLTCLKVARDSIMHGLQHGSALKVNPEEYSDTLQQPLACFVTLHKHGQLRGCIGTLQGSEALIQGIAEYAFAAAFQDPRFSALQPDEYNQLRLDISVLGKPEPINFKDEEDLLKQIRPGIDGLILEYGSHRGTFLPSVWEELKNPDEFFRHLKLKAGLPQDWWHEDVKVSRYETFLIEDNN